MENNAESTEKKESRSDNGSGALNDMTLLFPAKAENESFARVVVSAFLVRRNPTLEEVGDVKTAVSEAVTNAIVHGYRGASGDVTLYACVADDLFIVEVRDNGVGIADVEKAMKPFYTDKPDEERSGMGFTVMQTFMDEVSVESEVGVGTRVTMKKRLKYANGI